jgi:release factor glutamine methyltransferase
MKLILETLTGGADYLAKRGVEDARLNMEHLLAHVLGCRRLDLYLRFNEPLQEADLAPLRVLLKRRGEGEPLQHLLGSVEFSGSEFICDGRALIPRPETEFLVELVTRRLLRDAKISSVLDVGTGSGCIGLSLAKAWRDAEVTLSDVSEDALELARLNAERLGLRPRFVRSDLFERITGVFDLIIANLPYIPLSEKPALGREVLRDPATALFGGSDGLEIIGRFIEQCAAHLSGEGMIALELHHDQAAEAGGRLQSAGFRDIQTARDLAGIERFVFARRPETVTSPSEPTSS